MNKKSVNNIKIVKYKNQNIIILSTCKQCSCRRRRRSVILSEPSMRADAINTFLTVSASTEELSEREKKRAIINDLKDVIDKIDDVIGKSEKDQEQAFRKGKKIFGL